MDMKPQVDQALIHIYDAFNSDDGDSRYELALVEKYIEVLEAKTNTVALGIDALYLHCFATEVLKQLDEGTGDLFGIGEDCFIVQLYPYAELISSAHDKALEDKRNFKGTFVYDVMEELAGLFVDSIMRQQITVCADMAYELPELDEFKLDVDRVVPSYSIGPSFRG